MNAERRSSVPPSSREAGWSSRRIVFLGTSLGLLLAFAVWASEVMLPFVLALLVAYVLTPLVAWCERRRLPRSASILLVYAIVLGTAYGAIAAMSPRLYRESVGILREAPKIVHRAGRAIGPRLDAWVEQLGPKTPGPATIHETPPSALEVKARPDGSYGIDVGRGVDIVQEGPNRFRVEASNSGDTQGFGVTQWVEDSGDRFIAYVKKHAMEIFQLGRAIVTSAARGVFFLFMTLMVAGYLIHTREQIIAFFRGLAPRGSRLSFDRLLFRIDRGLSGVVRGQLVICVVNGILSAVGFWLFDLKYWPVLSLLAAVGSLIPIFGSVLSAIPAVAIGLTQDFWTGLWVLLWVLGIHQIEANLLNPKIIGIAARIHPCIVVVVLVTGEHFFGIWGALLAVPTWSVFQSLFLHFRSLVIPDSVDTVLPLFEAYRSSAPPAPPDSTPPPATDPSP